MQSHGALLGTKVAVLPHGHTGFPLWQHRDPLHPLLLLTRFPKHPKFWQLVRIHLAWEFCFVLNNAQFSIFKEVNTWRACSICVYMCVCVFMCSTCTCVHLCVKARDQRPVTTSFSSCHLCFEVSPPNLELTNSSTLAGQRTCGSPCLLSPMLRLQTCVSLTGLLHGFWRIELGFLYLSAKHFINWAIFLAPKVNLFLNMEFENFGMGKLICLPSLGHLLYLVWSYPSCKTGLMCLFSWVPAFLCPCLSLSQLWAWRAAYSQRQGMAFISRILEPVVYSCPRPRGRGRCLIHLISSAQSLLVAVPRSSVQTAGLNQIVSAFALLI